MVNILMVHLTVLFFMLVHRRNNSSHLEMFPFVRLLNRWNSTYDFRFLAQLKFRFLPFRPIFHRLLMFDPRDHPLSFKLTFKLHKEIPIYPSQCINQPNQVILTHQLFPHNSKKKNFFKENYEIYFKPTVCGTHWLNVNLNHVPMIDNPCRLIVRSSSSMESVKTSKDELFHAYTGKHRCDGRVVKALD